MAHSHLATFTHWPLRPTAQLHPGTKSGQGPTNRSEFKHMVMETMQRLSQRLDSLANKVKGRNERSNRTVTESPGATGSTTTLWADRPLDKPLDSLPMPQWNQDEEPAEIKSQTLIQVSESTLRALKIAFEKPLPDAARLQTWRACPFPKTKDTKCPKLDSVVKQNLAKEIKDSEASVAKLQTLSLMPWNHYYFISDPPYLLETAGQARHMWVCTYSML